MYEPDIFQTTRRFGTILENVDLDPVTRELDLDSDRFTENTRGAYPLEFIGNADPTGMAGRATERGPADGRCVRRPAADLAAHPRPGGLPLHQRLHRQAGRHRDRDQGAEGDVLDLLRRPVHAPPPGRVRARCSPSASAEWDVPVWLVNTGWTGGPYGTGERMNIDHTRSMVRAALNGELHGVPTVERPDLRGRGPDRRCPDVPAEFLQPRSTWQDVAAYDRGGGAGPDVRRELRRVPGRDARRGPRRRPARPVGRSRPGFRLGRRALRPAPARSHDGHTVISGVGES